jgi:hypothetical protein
MLQFFLRFSICYFGGTGKVYQASPMNVCDTCMLCFTNWCIVPNFTGVVKGWMFDDIIGGMKFYISGQIDDAKNINTIIKTVTSNGHQVTHNWTKTDTFLGGTQDKLNNISESGVRAKNDIKGVIDCDIFVLSSDNRNVGKGMYAELGAALALSETSGKPKVYIIGKLNHLSIFYLHPSVVLKKNIEEVLEDI